MFQSITGIKWDDFSKSVKIPIYIGIKLRYSISKGSEIIYKIWKIQRSVIIIEDSHIEKTKD